MRTLYRNRLVVASMLMLTLSACRNHSMTQLAAIPITQPTARTQAATFIQPTTVPDSPMQPTGGSFMPTATPVEMFYFWPGTVPSGLIISGQSSEATDRSFIMEFLDPTNLQNRVWIVSEPSMAEGMNRGVPITVRGQPGRLFSTGAGASVTWLEGTQWMRVGGFLLSTEEAIALAESLQPVDLTTWLANVRGNN